VDAASLMHINTIWVFICMTDACVCT
jgi:hypothetical protein